MPELAESVAAVRDGAKEDRFTYLTILQFHVKSPEILPTLNEVLEGDAQLTQDIGWDLVQMLLAIHGSETCLETVARLGNPREVIIKVMEALGGLSEAAADEDATSAAEGPPEPPHDLTEKFITLLGMLAILHRRIKTRYPSRFLGSSLVKVYEAYQPTPEMTASVINLVRSLSGRKRPPLPTRKSSINVANPDESGDVSKDAPDPEAEQEDPTEQQMKQRLLQSFVTCVLQRYINANAMQWSARLLEKFTPGKTMPHKKTLAQVYTDDETLHQRDAVVGQLVALIRDLGIDECPAKFVRSIYECPSGIDVLGNFEDFNAAEEIRLSPGGVASLIAYWVFSAEVFESDAPTPDMHIFPDHVTLLERFLGAEPQAEITENSGIADALLAIGLGLQKRQQISATEKTNFMAYHHHLTLIAVFHPEIQVRNAATAFSGIILHADPDDQNRLEILEDLLENCMFASLKACAVTWLKEELLAAQESGATNRFSSPDVIDHLQYFIFPDMLSFRDFNTSEMLDHWAQNGLFLLQVANFGYFLFSRLKDLVPNGMGSAVEQRFVEPLVMGAEKLQGLPDLGEAEKMEMAMLAQRLKSIPL